MRSDAMFSHQSPFEITIESHLKVNLKNIDFVSPRVHIVLSTWKCLRWRSLQSDDDLLKPEIIIFLFFDEQFLVSKEGRYNLKNRKWDKKELKITITNNFWSSSFL